jgi:hypothetical protein
MVALTPRCAEELGYDISDEDKKKSYIEVSGRKGFGVKADDLIDKLIAATQAEVDARQTGDRRGGARQKIAEQIAIGALRYFMLKLHAQLGHRLRLQRRAQLRGRDRTVHSVRRRAHPQHLPQGRHHARSGARGFRGIACPAAFGPYSRAKRTKTSGRCGCAPDVFPRFWSNASRRRSPPISPSTPSSSRRSSPTSTIAITSSRKKTPRAKPSSSPPPRSPCANSSLARPARHRKPRSDVKAALSY